MEETRNDRIARLHREHADLDARLREIDGHLSLTADEQIERARLKKLKLARKDEIARLNERG